MPDQPDSTGELVLVRHGESTFNAEQRFTGLLDVPLSPRGLQQCREAAELLIAEQIQPDRLITTPLQRAWRTAEVIAERLGLPPAVRDWRLAERDYGALTNVAKRQARQMLGEEAFFRLRRTMDGKPPPADAEQVAGWAGLVATGLGPLRPGMSESLREVIDRIRPMWQELQPELATGHHVLLVGHGNSLRAVCALVEQLPDEQVERLNLPTGQPLVYSFGRHGPTARYLDPHTAYRRAAVVAAEGGT